MASENYPQLDARHVVQVLGRKAWLIALLVVSAFVLTYGLSSLQPKVYTSVAEVSISSPDSTSAGIASANNKNPAILGNEMYLMRSPVVGNPAKALMGEDKFDEITNVNVGQVANTDVIRVFVSSRSPAIAQQGADAYANSYADLRQSQMTGASKAKAASRRADAAAYDPQIAEKQAIIKANPGSTDAQLAQIQLGDLQKSKAEALKQADEYDVDASTAANSVSVLKTANTPRFPDSPTPLRDAGVAAAVALVFGIGLVLLLDQLDNRIKTPDQISGITGGLPVLGSIPVFTPHARRVRRFHSAERTLVPPTSPSAEAYRTLATSLRFSNIGKEKRTILITSSSGGEGKTTVTANLAAVLVESGLRVVVVSADLRRPMLGELLGVTDTDKGLTSAMLGDDDLSSCFVSVPLRGRSLFVMPAGPLPHEPAVLLGSDMFGTVLDKIKQAGADFILIDCAPVLPVSDPLAASRHVDGVIVLTLAGKTRENSLRETIDRLNQVDADVIGIVVNGVPTKGAYQGYYGYRPYQRPDPPKGQPANVGTPPLDDSFGKSGLTNGNGSGNGNGAGSTRGTTGAGTKRRDPDSNPT